MQGIHFVLKSCIFERKKAKNYSGHFVTISHWNESLHRLFVQIKWNTNLFTGSANCTKMKSDCLLFNDMNICVVENGRSETDSVSNKKKKKNVTENSSWTRTFINICLKSIKLNANICFISCSNFIYFYANSACWSSLTSVDSIRWQTFWILLDFFLLHLMQFYSCQILILFQFYSTS